MCSKHSEALLHNHEYCPHGGCTQLAWWQTSFTENLGQGGRATQCPLTNSTDHRVCEAEQTLHTPVPTSPPSPCTHALTLSIHLLQQKSWFMFHECIWQPSRVHYEPCCKLGMIPHHQTVMIHSQNITYTSTLKNNHFCMHTRCFLHLQKHRKRDRSM